jgi:glycine/D-amino acid oxidase-like deaminating enzyme
VNYALPRLKGGEGDSSSYASLRYSEFNIFFMFFNYRLEMEQSTWIRTAGKEAFSYPPLENDISADICIIGSGIVGTTAAYLLSKSGKSVVLITDKTADTSSTAHTTGFLTTTIDTPLAELARMFGTPKAGEIWRSGAYAIDGIENIANSEEIECELSRVSHFIYAAEDTQYKEIEEDAELGKKLGFPIEARNGGLPFGNSGYSEMKNQGKFHALKYIRGLTEAAKRNGAKIFDHTEAKKIEYDGDKRIVRTKSGNITAADVLIATYRPFTKPKELFAHTGPYITYIIESSLPKGILPEAIYEDAGNPYHYFRLDPQDEEDRLIMGGEDHRKEIPNMEDKSYKALLKHIGSLLPQAPLSVKAKWSWTILEPIDGLPFIGPLQEDAHQYVVTGLSGTGLTLGHLSGEIIADAILERPNKWAHLYAPDRHMSAKQLAFKGRDYIEEFVGGAVKNVFE